MGDTSSAWIVSPSRPTQRQDGIIVTIYLGLERAFINQGRVYSFHFISLICLDNIRSLYARSIWSRFQPSHGRKQEHDIQVSFS